MLKEDTLYINYLNNVDPIIFDIYGTRYAKNSTIPSKLSNKTIKYFKNNCENKPYLNQLVLLALVMEYKGIANGSIYSLITNLATRLDLFFVNNIGGKLELKNMKDFELKINDCFCYYLGKKNAVAKDSNYTKIDFYERYRSAVNHLSQWFLALPQELKSSCSKFLLPPFNEDILKGYVKKLKQESNSKTKRKTDVNALMDEYPKIRKMTHLRMNFIRRLYQTFVEIIKKKPNKTVNFEVLEGGVLLKFRILKTSNLIENLNIAMNGTDYDDYILQFIDEDIADVETQDILWFHDICKHLMFETRHFTVKSIKLIKDYNYSKTGFHSKTDNFLSWTNSYLMSNISNKIGGIIIPIKQIYIALLHGTMAVELITTTGMRHHEILQINLDQDCLVLLNVPIYEGDKILKKISAISLRTIPKGENENKLSDNFVGKRVVEMMTEITDFLKVHYNLKKNATLPTIPYTKYHNSNEKFKERTYIFQLNGKAITPADLTLAIKFILHGLNVRNINGDVVSYTSHLLRHGFATHSVNVARIPIDIVAAIMKHKSLATTLYYSEPTTNILAEHSDLYLNFINNQLDIDEILKRSPIELQNQYLEISSKTGTLAQVIGGHCSSHGLCQAQFSCLGCAAKLPDPNQKHQIIHQKEWAQNQLKYFQKEGFMPEVRKMNHVIDAANRELSEIEMIEEYLDDKKKINIYQITDE